MQENKIGLPFSFYLSIQIHVRNDAFYFFFFFFVKSSFFLSQNQSIQIKLRSKPIRILIIRDYKLRTNIANTKLTSSDVNVSCTDYILQRSLSNRIHISSVSFNDILGFFPLHSHIFSTPHTSWQG